MIAIFINQWLPILWPVVGVCMAVTGCFYAAKEDEPFPAFLGIFGGALWPVALVAFVVTSPFWGAAWLGFRMRDKAEAKRLAFVEEQTRLAKERWEAAKNKWLEDNKDAPNRHLRIPFHLERFRENDWIEKQ